MQFHHHGYVSGDPRQQPALGTGVDRPEELPDQMDVLIVGSGPAGMLLAAQLSQFPSINTRIIERREGRLVIGQADGVQQRSVETFQAFGFAEEITAEAYRITETRFWKQDPANPENIVRGAVTPDDPQNISEFPHLIVNQARVLDYFARFMQWAPTRMKPDYGWDFQGLEIDESAEYPVAVTLERTAGPDAGSTRTVRAKYVVGCDGARSKVRKSIGCTMKGDAANHAWGVMDVVATTTFPDIRAKSIIHSAAGSMLHIPREGGHLFRMYVDLGEQPADGNGAVRQTPIEEIIKGAQAIIHPYELDVKDVAWWSVYEVGHRVTDHFDNLRGERTEEGRIPRVFLTGDACHTHSAKAGQGMNVSMQDGFNLGWKLAHVLTGRAPEKLLRTYSAERQVVAQNLIDFDKQWSTLMAKKSDALSSPDEVEDFYMRTAEFPAGFMTEYPASLLVGSDARQELAPGFPLGKRFKSTLVERVNDGNPIHLGHQHLADGRWRIYVFSDQAAPGTGSASDKLGDWLSNDPASPLAAQPADGDTDAWFDVKVVYQQPHLDVDINAVPVAFKPTVGPFKLTDTNKVYGSGPDGDIFEARGISRDGAIVVVRPDMYVAHILPLDATQELANFFDPILGR
ncbi:FAD-binding monooxygenase [Luteococcus peritonei]|uniref:FAD-binding monooxygenase n=1 Tax=Luteococcus peritonei TaxID=88874 RepID=A0ABW4RVA6_9ACTN